MQRQVGVPSSLVLVIQGLTMVFVLSSLGRTGQKV
jgi:simple sugar transport system permease protein